MATATATIRQSRVHAETTNLSTRLRCLPVRVLLLAVLCSQLSSLATGSPISSIPASSAPGFQAGEVAPAPAPAPASASNDGLSRHPWVDTAPTKPSLPESEDETNQDWGLEHKDPAAPFSSPEETQSGDESDSVGSAIDKGMNSGAGMM